MKHTYEVSITKEEPVLIHQAYKYVLSPSSEQIEYLEACCGASRFWYNTGLALVKERWARKQAGEDVSVPWSYHQLCSAFKGDAMKDSVAPWRKEVSSGAYTAGLEALGSALQQYSKRKKAGYRTGFPKFKQKGRSHESVVFTNPRFTGIKLVLFEKRLGPIRSKESFRKLTRLLDRDPNARILRATVQKQHGEWVVSFNVERSSKERPVRKPNTVIGIDLGLTRLATLSDGTLIENRRCLRTEERKLTRAQRKLDRQRRAMNPGNYNANGTVRKGSLEWVESSRMKRTRVIIQRCHKRVTNLRKHQAHLLTTTLTREYGVIGVESLNVRGMLKNKRLAKHISDAGWGMILNQLKYKTAWAGSELVHADKFYPSSKTCSACGSVKTKLALSERVYECEHCETIIDRDVNAAINLAMIAAEQARIEGKVVHVARMEQDTLNARGGQHVLGRGPTHRSLKREDSAQAESPPGCEAQALAA